ncbi:hypothetical protein, partial [Pseudomonas sp. 10S4]|uniref:hypothetical protein n=1 Tax=Pseudomonas sp. 10S4 TaxID=3048583 RepID=UPI002B22A1EA
FHDRPRYDLDDQKIRQLREFSHSLDPKLTLVRQKTSDEFPAIAIICTAKMASSGSACEAK